METSSDLVQFLRDNANVVAGVAAAVVGATTYYWITKPRQMKMLVDLNQQSIEMEGGVRRSPLVKDPYSEECLLPGVRTVYDGFQRGLRLSRGRGNCLGKRRGPGLPYDWLSYSEVYKRVKNFGSGLLWMGLEPNPENYLGIYSINRIEACNTYSMVVVPLYDTLGPNASSFIVNQAKLSVILCDTAERASNLLKKAHQILTLKHIILMDDVPEDLSRTAKRYGITTRTFKDVEVIGENNPKAPVPPKPSDLATICYTSGTTGDPKGIMLTHDNMISNLSCLTVFDMMGFKTSTEDVHISYLPLPHMFERCIQIHMLLNGAQIGFYGGDTKLLFEDMQEVKPTILCTVPRILNRLHDQLMTASKESRLKSFIFNLALSKKAAELKRHIVRRDSIWDILVLRQAQNILGGKVKCIMTGSAPITPTVLQFLRCCFGCLVLEGYGQTEANAPMTLCVPGDYEAGIGGLAGHVGGPIPCNHLKLTDVPEMGYFVADGKGEICGKGPNVCQGYFKNPELTAELFDDEGWLHTGDIGTWLPNGALKIIDRRKNIFKLAQGEYIAPMMIETIYGRSQFVAQVFVHGNSLQPYPMAVVVPDPDELIPWAKQRGLDGDIKALCLNEEVKNMIHKDMTTVGKARGLKPYEQAKDILLHPEPFTVENGLLTPTLKNKRPPLTKFFNEALEQLYSKY